jgi:membrane fusion protein, multidrug efflux system
MPLKKVHTVVAVLGLAVAAGAAWWVQREPARASVAAPERAEGNGPVAVEVGHVQLQRIEEDAQAVGSVRSRQGVMLRPEVAGRIERLGFADGQRVRRGQLLVQLDDTLQQAQLKQAQAQASIARTNLHRNRELVAEGFVSQSVVDQTAAVLEVAVAQVALAQAQLDRMRINAPFDGVVGIRNVNLGDFVQDGADLVSVEDISSVWVDFRLPERFLARVRPGQAVDVTLDAMPGQRFTGHVDALDALLDANGRSMLVRARLDNQAGVLKTGMFARTRIVFTTRDGALVVPEEALVPQGGKQWLVKVVDGPQGLRSQRVEARVGVRLPGQAEVLGGVVAGDMVVTAGQAKLLRADGLALRIVEVPRSPARAASGAAAPASAARVVVPAV